MNKHLLSVIAVSACHLLLGSPVLEAAERDDQQTIDFIIRLGAGGFRDDRSPENALGGDQAALDIKLPGRPIALSLSSEFYTNSADATHSYEIAGMSSFNVLYMNQLLDYENTRFFFGGGLGRLEVPDELNDANSRVSALHYNLEAGVNTIVWRKLGLYGTVKYLHARRSIRNTRLIDFNELILLLGITFNFSV